MLRLPDSIIPLPAFKFNLHASKPDKILEKRNILSKKGAFYLTNKEKFVIISKKDFFKLDKLQIFCYNKRFWQKKC